MALNWHIDNCKNYKELWSDDEKPITDMMIWLTMFVGISEITEKNVDKFYERTAQLEKADGTFLMNHGKPRAITRADVERRIGLRTNAYELNEIAWKKKLKKKVTARTVTK